MGREEQADAELNEFLASLNAEESPQQLRARSSSAQATEPNTSVSPAPPSSIAPDSLYPDTMSCRSAFDYAFFCQSFGGQFVNYYRYGELRSCNEHWNNFWTCMKARAYSDEERRKVIRNLNREKTIKYRTGPSSEDVWSLRTEPVKDAFHGDFIALEKEMKLEEEVAQKSNLN